MAKPSSPTEKLVFLLCGQTGSGKSATGNVASGLDNFEEGEGPDSVTSTATPVDFRIQAANGTVYEARIIDVIGFLDSERSEISQIEHFGFWRDLAPGGLNGVLFVQHGGLRFDKSQQETVRLMTQLFSETSQPSYTGLVFTHRPCSPTKSKEEYDRQIMSSQSWPPFLPFFRGGRIYIDNKEQPEEAKEQLHKLMLEIAAKNNFVKMSNRSFNEALQYFEQRRLDIDALPTDLRDGPEANLLKLYRAQCQREDLEESIRNAQAVEAERQEEIRLKEEAEAEAARQTVVARQEKSKADRATAAKEEAVREKDREASRRKEAEQQTAQARSNLADSKKQNQVLAAHCSELFSRNSDLEAKVDRAQKDFESAKLQVQQCQQDLKAVQQALDKANKASAVKQVVFGLGAAFATVASAGAAGVATLGSAAKTAGSAVSAGVAAASAVKQLDSNALESVETKISNLKTTLSEHAPPNKSASR